MEDLGAAEQVAAIAPGTLEVRYVPDDPRVNLPVVAPGSPGGRGLIAMAIGAAMLLGALVGFAMSR